MPESVTCQRRDLQPLLRPNSVAVIGVSSDTTIIRGRLLNHLLHHKFPGPVYAVSRSQAEVQGLKTYPGIADLPGPVDLAVIVVPAALVPEALRECGERGIKAAAIISSGFAEEVGAEASARTAELYDIAERYGIAVCGPNSEGLMCASSHLSASFTPVVGPAGGPLMPLDARGKSIGVVGQSGAMTFAFLSRGRLRSLTFDAVISTGNQLNLEAHEYVADWLEAGGPDIFILYLEKIVDGARFRAVADRARALGKPIIVAKIGRSDAGRRAAASHTGSLASVGRIDDAVFRHHGVIPGQDIDHILDIATAMAFCPPPRGKGVAIITGSGGGAAWMSDLLCAEGLEVPVLEEEVQAEIRALLPPFGAAHNPIDGTAQAMGTIGYARLMEIAMKSSRVDIILLIGSLVNEEAAHKAATAIAPLVGRGIPIVFCCYRAASPRSIAILADIGVPCFTAMQNCARAIRVLVDQAAAWRQISVQPPLPVTDAGVRAATAAALRASGATLTEWDSKAILAGYGVPRPPEFLATTEDEAVAAARRIGGPVALKLQSPDILHKTEAGAVILGARDEGAVRDAYQTVIRNGAAAVPGASVRGVLVQAMAGEGREVILGITRHDSFGPMLMVGIGGILVEALNDVAFAPVPIDEAGALALLDQLKTASLLGSVRGKPPADRAALARLMATLSRFAADHADVVQEIDLNPVIVHPEGQGLTIVDALIVRRGA